MTLTLALLERQSVNTNDPEDWGSLETIDGLKEEIRALRLEVATLRSKLGQCFRGESVKVRNELILEAIQCQTKEALKMSTEDLKEYLEYYYDC